MKANTCLTSPTLLRCLIAGHPVRLVACAVVLIAQTVFAQSWYTVDDFQYSPGKLAYATGLAKDPSGTIIYSVGTADDGSGGAHLLVFESVDGGGTWSLSDDYTGLSDSLTNPGGANLGIVADPAGNLYAYGNGRNANGSDVSFVRSLPAGGSAWVTVDLFTNATPWAVTTDLAGNVYVVGGSGNGIWLVRKGTPSNSGISWANVDAFSSPNGGCTAYGVFCHPAAGIFVVGVSPVAVMTGYQGAWTVRCSQDGGASWSTVDTFQLVSPRNNGLSTAFGAGTDFGGNLYVVGKASQTFSKSASAAYYDHWIVRKSANPGATSPSWSIVDNFQPASNYSARPRAFATDAYGNLFVAGQGYTSTGWAWWVRESAGANGAWITVDNTFQAAWPYNIGLVGDISGHVYVAGGAIEANAFHWIVRKN